MKVKQELDTEIEPSGSLVDRTIDERLRKATSRGERAEILAPVIGAVPITKEAVHPTTMAFYKDEGIALQEKSS